MSEPGNGTRLPEGSTIGTAKLRVAFVVDEFPAVTETFIIDQVAGLLDRGAQVEVFAWRDGRSPQVSRRFDDYGMAARTHYLGPPPGKLTRLFAAAGPAWRLLLHRPAGLIESLNPFRHGSSALNLRLLYAAAAFAGKRFDVIHCHFGTHALKFLPIHRILGAREPLVTTLYGYDISLATRWAPAGFYDELIRQGSLFYVMSENMRERAVAQGFPTDRTRVHPVGVDADSLPFRERIAPRNGPVELIAVGRLVEKKGFDDLLRALAIVRDRGVSGFRCTIVGGGPLDADLKAQASSLNLGELVAFRGPMRLEDIVALFDSMHFLIAPSKTAANGDME